MIKATVLSTWISEKGEYRPDVFRFLQAGDSAMDVTGEQSVFRHTKNPVIVELWCSKETLSVVETAYGADAILKCVPFDEQSAKPEEIKAVIAKAKIEAVLLASVGEKPSLKTADCVCEVIEWIKARPAEAKELEEEKIAVKKTL